MKVLHVHSGNLFGGVERVLQTLTSVDSSTTGLENEFALCFEGELGKRLQKRGSRVRTIGEVQIRRPVSILRARRRLREILQSERPDVLVSHSVWVQATLGKTLREAGLPLVLWAHDALDGKHWLQRIAAHSPPDLVLCASQFSASRIPLVYPGVPTEVIHYPLEYTPLHSPATRQQTRRSLGVGDSDVVILQLGRLEPYKGHRILIDALGRMKDLPGWVCWQVGGVQREQEKQYLVELENQARRLGVADRVRFVGQQIEVPRFMGSADIYCQPNVEPEPFGLVFVEAMQEGLAVVTSATGGGAEIVGELGWLVPPQNADELAAVLTRLVLDPDLRTTGSERRRERARATTDPVSQVRELTALLRKHFSLPEDAAGK